MDVLTYILAKKNVTGSSTSGVDGKSAYQIWLDAGNTGTEADFLASLKGVSPVKGIDYWTVSDKQEIIDAVEETWRSEIVEVSEDEINDLFA